MTRWHTFGLALATSLTVSCGSGTEPDPVAASFVITDSVTTSMAGRWSGDAWLRPPGLVEFYVNREQDSTFAFWVIAMPESVTTPGVYQVRAAFLPRDPSTVGVDWWTYLVREGDVTGTIRISRISAERVRADFDITGLTEAGNYAHLVGSFNAVPQ